ncbi:unnamed protein product [Gongylonema pulchrum]|uniref:FANCI_HD2 domain-containing protein n=1 Tax=Gongylonema pulchrum TaxID=637853 RepID=A0A183EJ47_9BILA|nr:unnamed protein product [Gongylonema pulchrum]
MGKSMLVLLAGANTESIGDLLERIFTMLCKYYRIVLLFSLSAISDTIVEIVLKHTVHVLNAWKSLEGWIDSIFNLKQVIILPFKAQLMQLCTIQNDIGISLVRALLPIIVLRPELVSIILNQDIGISLVRALLPIIVLRPELVSIILNQVKQHVLCDSTVPIALPTLLLLLRSSTMRSAMRNDYYSQSFATFSTQALQNMGVDTKNTNVEVSLEIIGILKRTLSQPANVKIILYRGIVEAAYANQNLLDKLADFSMSAAGRTNLCFASMMNSLYDALIEHLWHVGYVLSKYHFLLSVFYLKVLLKIVVLRS